jgi:hypothetical protein
MCYGVVSDRIASVFNATYREQQLENCIALLIFQTYYPLGKTRIDEKHLLLCDRVYPDNGMIALDRIASHEVTIAGRIFSLRKPAMLSSEAFQEYLEWLG